MTESQPRSDAFSREAAAGLILLSAALLALGVANSAFYTDYEAALAMPVTFGWPPVSLTKPLLLWINDGLMAIFFLLVGLEIKREALIGPLAHWKSAALPAIAAVGGMIVPALIYIAINWENTAALRGWAIPAATDIAFAVGVMALLGRRVPASLRTFLLALAIIDDLGAIIIIAIFYTSHLSLAALALAGAGVTALIALNRSRVMSIWPYLLVGAFVWVCVLKSGVHATLAGVVTALAIPFRDPKHADTSPLLKIEHALGPWVSFAIVPIFAFANAGVSLAGMTPAELLMPIPLGIALGLFVGKTIGIYGFARLAIATKAGSMPAHATDLQLFGTAVLGGIGFTMSLFIGMLAFPGEAAAADLRLGVLTGSLVSAVVGFLILRYADGRARR